MLRTSDAAAGGALRLELAAALNNRDRISRRVADLLPDGCRRILLVVPPHVPEEDYSIEVARDNRYPVYPPYGYAVLASDLARRGYVADIVDLNFELQRELKRAGTLRYDVWKEWLKSRIGDFKPDMIGLTCMFTVAHRSMMRVADFVKSEAPRVPVIAGGVHATTASQLVLKASDSIDLIALFEGNQSFGDLIDHVNGKLGSDALSQIATLIGDEYVALTERAKKTEGTVNIIPDYRNLDIGAYSDHGRIGTYYWLWPPGTRGATALSAVGCRAQCTFCSVRTFNGRGVSTRGVSSVVDEIELLRDRYGVRHIMWLDDDLLYDEGRAIALFQEMVNRRVGITWDASNGVIASAMTAEIAAAASESGCIGLSIGIESGNDQILRSVKKPSRVKHFHRCAEILKDHPRIFTKGLLMVGFPRESIGMMLDTVKLATDIALDWYTIQPLNLIPGVEITNHAIASGVITEREIIDGTERPFVGSTGGQIRREAQEKVEALPFVNLFAGDASYVPDRREIKDVWMVMDWKVNYERLPELSSRVKLEMIEKLFVSVCDRTHHTNALGNLYFAMIEGKLGRPTEARRRLALARRFATESDYWRKRFEVLGLDVLLAELGRSLPK